MSRGDVYQLSFEEICETCKHIPRGRKRVSKLASKSVSQVELGNLFDKFETIFVRNLSEQGEILRMKDEKKEDDDICVFHAESHAIKYFPSLPRLKDVY